MLNTKHFVLTLIVFLVSYLVWWTSAPSSMSIEADDEAVGKLLYIAPEQGFFGPFGSFIWGVRKEDRFFFMGLKPAEEKLHEGGLFTVVAKFRRSIHGANRFINGGDFFIYQIRPNNSQGTLEPRLFVSKYMLTPCLEQHNTADTESLRPDFC